MKSVYLFLRRAFLHIALLAGFILFYAYIVAPWGDEHNFLGGRKLLEGNKGYRHVISVIKPNLATALRGLNMSGTAYRLEWAEGGKNLSFGNVEITFDERGEFMRIAEKGKAG